MLVIPFAVMALAAVLAFAVLPDREPAYEGISRAAACKAAALSLTAAENCREEAETDRSRFAASEQRLWYVKYMDYLYRRGMLSEEMTPAEAGTAEGDLTITEAAYLAERLAEAAGRQEDAQRMLDIIGMTGRNRGKPIPADRWWELYDVMRETAGAGGENETGRQNETGVQNEGGGEDSAADPGRVTEEILQIEGTPDNVKGADAWAAYTDRGVYGFEGIGLSAYMDRQVRVLARGREIIRVTGVVSEEVVYRNVWIVDASEDSVTGFTGDFTRVFAAEKKLTEPEGMENQLADIRMAGGSVEKISLKNEKLTAKVLSVREDAIELEGYGLIPLDEDFCVYQTYGELKRQGIDQILVGYDTQEFVAADGKLCAALIVRGFGAESIRVLVMDTGFRSIFHPEISLEFLSDGIMRQGERETVYHAGDHIVVSAQPEEGGSGRVALAPGDERIQFLPSDESAGIRVASVERGQGKPVFPGRMEVICGEEGLVLINELYLEDYLKRVIPSEMPADYEPEALKAQAVCARTYAYRQIRGNAYRQYGAHVDDSTNYQVYNNSSTAAASSGAVDATYGQLLMYGGDAAETYYFSTSCGYTTDMAAWGEEPERTPYLHSVEVGPAGAAVFVSGSGAEAGSAEDTEAAGAAPSAGSDTEAAGAAPSAGSDTETDGAAFEAFIRGDGSAEGGYEASYAMYRWQTQITGSLLQENIPDIGRITELEVTERGAGGVAQCVTVTGTEGTKEIRGESRIRAALGHPDLVITRANGSTVSGWSGLPSAFISIECGGTGGGELVCTVYGGGYGHGIGMSQNGAQAMAKRGWTYEQILGFFYGGTTLETVY